MARKEFELSITGLTNSLKLTKQLENMFSSIASKTNEFISEQEKLGKGFMSLGDKIKTGGTFALNQFHDALKKTPKWLTAATGAISGFITSFKLLKGALSVSIKGVQSLASSVLGLVDAMIKLPLDYLKAGLQEYNRNLLAVMHATEAMREQFGGLSEGIGEVALNMAKGATVIGTLGGRYQERLQMMTQALAGAGAAFEALMIQLSPREQKNLGSMIITLSKGFGLTGEQLEGIARVSTMTGESFKQLTRRILSGVEGVAKATNISRKSLGRDVGAMLDDMNSFGTLSVEVATAAAGRLRSLGIAAKDVVGVIKQFDTFKQAATSVGLLTQVFGMQFDAYAMMNEQDPAKRIDMLREAAFRAGKDFQSLSRQEQNFLAQQSGLDMKTASLVFSLENQGKSYADIQKGAKKAVSPQQAMAKALKNIEGTLARILTHFKTYESFGDAMNEGIMRALGLGKKGNKLFGNYQKTLQLVMKETQKLTVWILENFPGVNKIWDGFAKTLDPKRWSGFLIGIGNAFKSFTADGLTDWKGFTTKIKDEFEKAFGKDAWKDISEGTDELKNVLVASAEAAWSYFGPKLEKFAEETLKPALKKILNKVGGWIWEGAKDHWEIIALALFGKAAIQGLLAYAGHWALQGLTVAMKTSFASSLTSILPAATAFGTTAVGAASVGAVAGVVLLGAALGLAIGHIFNEYIWTYITGESLSDAVERAVFQPIGDMFTVSSGKGFWHDLGNRITQGFTSSLSLGLKAIEVVPFFAPMVFAYNQTIGRIIGTTSEAAKSLDKIAADAAERAGSERTTPMSDDLKKAHKEKEEEEEMWKSWSGKIGKNVDMSRIRGSEEPKGVKETIDALSASKTNDVANALQKIAKLDTKQLANATGNLSSFWKAMANTMFTPEDFDRFKEQWGVLQEFSSESIDAYRLLEGKGAVLNLQQQKGKKGQVNLNVKLELNLDKWKLGEALYSELELANSAAGPAISG